MNSDDVKEYTKSVSIMYVDTKEEITDEIVSTLGDFFAKVAIFSDSQLALEAYQKSKFDIVLLGLDIVSINALVFIKELKALHSYQHIIVASSSADVNTLLNLLNMGIDKFAPKPLTKKRLVSTLFNISKSLIDSNHKYDETKESIIKAKEYEKIVDVVDNGLIVVDETNTIDANKFALKALKVDSIFGLDTMFFNLKNKLIKADGYIYVDSLKDLINLTKDSGNFHRLLLKGEMENQVLMFSIHTLSENKKYVISFSDVTALDNLDRYNQLTKLPNSVDFTNKINLFKDTTYKMAIICIKNFNQIIKWHGKTAGFETEKKIADFLQNIITLINIDDSSYIAHLEKNQYLVIVKKENFKEFVALLSKMSEQSSIKVDSNSEKKEIPFAPAYKEIDFEKIEDINDLISKINDEFILLE